MAKPRVFISSTFYDLKYIRASLEQFVLNLGFEPILSEKGSIAYNPDLPLDESCYNEAQICDIFVMIIGGRYGSEISATKSTSEKEFYERYTSITQKEYDSANNKNIPVYIFIEKNVYTEYDLFRSNKDNKSINYVQVDSENIFYMIDKIVNQPYNNPIYPFEKPHDIEIWLKEQWAGLFRDLLLRRRERNNLLSLSTQIENLEKIKNSLETIIQPILNEIPKYIPETTSKEVQLINNTSKTLLIKENIFVQELVKYYDVAYEEIINIFEKATCLEEIARFVNKYSPNKTEKKLLVEWRVDPNQLHNVNSIREVLHLPPLNFMVNK